MTWVHFLSDNAFSITATFPPMLEPAPTRTPSPVATEPTYHNTASCVHFVLSISRRKFCSLTKSSSQTANLHQCNRPSPWHYSSPMLKLPCTSHVQAQRNAMQKRNTSTALAPLFLSQSQSLVPSLIRPPPPHPTPNVPALYPPPPPPVSSLILPR